ncbi:MAG: hypothetical protein ACI4MF_10325 [Candidatus Faecivicinus sp.]
MTQVYDTERIRKAARLVEQLSLQLENETLNGMKCAVEEAGNLKGRAAQALEERAEQLGLEVRRIDSELEKLGRQLRQFAARIDEADDRAASMMQ